MTAAIVTLAAALVASLGLLAYLSVRLVSALDDVSDLRAHEEALAGQLLVAQANAETQTNRADAEKRRADALIEEMDRIAADAAADPAGSKLRMLARYARARAADGDSARAVPASTDAPAEPGLDRDGLIRPDE